MLMLDAASEVSLAQQIEIRIRQILADPAVLTRIGQAGQVFTRELYAPERQIGERQRILRSVAQRLGLPVPMEENPLP